MKKLSSILLVLGILFLASCGSDSKHENANITVQNTSGLRTGDGLDLQAVGEIIKKSNNAEEIEKELNKSGGINNLDLNEDGKTDYINVQEYGGNGQATGFSLTTNLSEGDVQEIATIEVELNGNTQADVHISGNEHMYGSGAHYHSRYSASDMILMAYLLRPHPLYYHRPYYPGFYPTYYSPYRPVPMATYRTRTRTVTSRSTMSRSITPRKSSISSPNKNKVAPTVKKRSLSTNNTSSLKKKNNNYTNQGGGFGTKNKNKTTTTTNRNTAPKKTNYTKPRTTNTTRRSGGSSFGSRRKSDSTWKTDITVINNAVAQVQELGGYTYHWRVDEYPQENFSTDLQMGLIAQEVEAVYPLAVFTRPDGKKEVDYAAMVPLLVQALKEQQAEIDALKTQLAQ